MCLCYISQQSGQAGVENGAMLTTFIYSDILQNAPFRSQIFLIFFASGGKGALTPHNQNPADVPGSVVCRLAMKRLRIGGGQTARPSGSWQGGARGAWWTGVPPRDKNYLRSLALRVSHSPAG